MVEGPGEDLGPPQELPSGGPGDRALGLEAEDLSSNPPPVTM